MRHGYVLCESRNRGTIGQWYETVRLVPVDPTVTPVDELTCGLRGWALKALASGPGRDAWYEAFLVEMGEDDWFDTYDPIHWEEIVWCHEQEYLPAH